MAADAADNGSSNAGIFVSYRATSDLDRALGGLVIGACTSAHPPHSGAVAESFALALVNASGAAIPSLGISYHGKQWRNGGTIQAIDNMASEFGESAMLRFSRSGSTRSNLAVAVVLVSGSGLATQKDLAALVSSSITIPAGSTLFRSSYLDPW